jgi:hypothetical protein
MMMMMMMRCDDDDDPEILSERIFDPFDFKYQKIMIIIKNILTVRASETRVKKKVPTGQNTR